MSEPAHILVVDDHDEIRNSVSSYLERNGMRTSVAESAAEMDAQRARHSFDLIVLDVMMPGEDGLTACKRLRQECGTPVLMLTARGEAEHRIEGLQVGADDYLGKPFEPQELLLRIGAILRRTAERPAVGSALALGLCVFDPARGELSQDGAPVRLTEGEAALLKRLAQTPHEPVDRLELARDTVDPSGRAVDVQVTRLRRKIETDPKAPRYLQTVRGVGYMLAPD